MTAYSLRNLVHRLRQRVASSKTRCSHALVRGKDDRHRVPVAKEHVSAWLLVVATMVAVFAFPATGFASVGEGVSCSPARGQKTNAHRSCKTGRRARPVVIYGRVIRSTWHELVVVTGRGRVLHFRSKPIPRRPGRPTRGSTPQTRGAKGRHVLAATDDRSTYQVGLADLGSLQPGTAVVITEVVHPSGNVEVEITLPEAVGSVSAITNDAVTISTNGGSRTFGADAATMLGPEMEMSTM